MSVKDSLIEKLQSRINAWQKEVEEKKAEASREEAEAENQKAEAKLKRKTLDRVHALENNISEARQKIDQLRQAGESQIEDLKRRVDSWLK
ncbi:MAG: hypothetical protein ACQERN_02360 [Thermodesulfobacteriota bacterium]